MKENLNKSLRNFENNIWSQNCGDSLKIIGKSNEKTKDGHILFECEFQKYFYRVLATKNNILKGRVNNPQIEQVEFVDKIWPQHCGDSLKIIKKSTIKKESHYLWECEFIKYPCKICIKKGYILRGVVKNPKLPWLNKENLIQYIQENFKEKPTLKELANSLNVSYPLLSQKINKFELNNLIKYYDYSGEENQIRDFVKSIYNGRIEKYFGKKEDDYKDIDIYLPELCKGIEYNGSYWHKEGDDLFNRPLNYHKNKKELFINKGINILFVWDYEWFEDFPKNKIINEQTKQKIREFLLK